jgi:hypothetical protein
MNVLEIVSSVEDQVFDIIETGESLALDAVKTIAGVVEPVASQVPQAPLGDTLPTPAALVDHAFDLAERVLANQRKFVKQLFDAYDYAPAASAPKAKTAPKPTVVSSEAKSA